MRPRWSSTFKRWTVRPIGAAACASLVATGCALRPFTPSVNVAFFAEEVPAGRAITLPSSKQVLDQWQLDPASPWAPYGKLTLISALDALPKSWELPDVRSLDIVKDAQASAEMLAARGLPADTMILLDLRGAASVAFTHRLLERSRQPIAPVLTFNNWPSERGMVPADETLAALVEWQPSQPQSAQPDASVPTTPVFMLDAWRLAYRDDQPDDDVYDNRYMLMPNDLPSPEALRAAFITRVLYVVEDLDETDLEEDDLHDLFSAYQAAGIGIHLVDLSWLKSKERTAPWADALAPRTHWVRPRATLMHDPWFYSRARSGFGGVHGRPSIGPFGSGRGPSGFGGG